MFQVKHQKFPPYLPTLTTYPTNSTDLITNLGSEQK